MFFCDKAKLFLENIVFEDLANAGQKMVPFDGPNFGAVLESWNRNWFRRADPETPELRWLSARPETPQSTAVAHTKRAPVKVR